MLSNKYFFIADTHFYHSKVIAYEERPFENVDEMNSVLITNWNKTVKDGNEVFVLGDFGFCGKEKMLKIVRQLNGYKRLIMGNHDVKSVSFYRNVGFDEVIKYPIVWENDFILSHQPIDLDENCQFKNIYGHVHNKSEYSDYTDKTFCASVERINYKPIEFDDIRKKMQSYRPINAKKQAES